MVKRDFFAGILLMCLLLLGGLLARFFLFTSYEVSKTEANLFLNEGDYVLVSKQSEPDYRDFVVYVVDTKRYLGRVIAKEGDTVAYMDDILYLNNTVEADDYLSPLKHAFQEEHPDILFTDDFNISTLTNSTNNQIPENQFLILNDNRKSQSDSRQFGLISRDQIKGVVSFRLYPFSKFGFVSFE